MVPRMSRRSLLRLIGVGAAASLLAACTKVVKETVVVTQEKVVKETVVVEGATKVVEKAVEKVVTATPVAVKNINSVGVELPADAAPSDQQYISYTGGDLAGYLEFFKTSFYQGSSAGGMAPYLQASLMRLDENGEAIPDAAEAYPSISKDGLVWTFKIRKGMVWSDGEPLTAHDWVFSFQRAANPKTGFDWGWFYYPIKNWQQIEAGKLPVEQLGAKAVDDYTLEISTDAPVPFIPMIMTHSYVSPKHVVEKLGDDWSTRFETLVYSGPFILSDWKKGRYWVISANPNYKGPLKPYLNKLICRVSGAGAGTAATVQEAYLNHETEVPAPISRQDLPAIMADPVLSKWVHSYPDYHSYYLMMDSTKAPFDNVKVRQALAKAIDRELICNTTLKGVAAPAWEMLPKGFPAHNPELKKFQNIDVAAAQKLLAEAGFEGGKNFPKLELWVRNEAGRIDSMKPLAEFVQAQWKKNLNIDIDVKLIEMKVWIDARSKREHPFMMGSYQYDYIDPSNLLDFLKCGGHGFYCDKKFDELLTKADTNALDPKERIKQYQEAEAYLCEQAGTVFLIHDLNNQLIPPYLTGPALQPNKDGLIVWRGNRLGTSEFRTYISKEALNVKRPSAEAK